MARHRIDSVAKLKICNFVMENSPNTNQVLDFAQELLGRRLSQSTISTILRANNLQIQREGGRGRRVLNLQALKHGSRGPNGTSFEAHDDEISDVANIPYKHLTMLTVGRSRNRGSRNSKLEVHMLEEIYLTLVNGTKIITRELLVSYVNLICAKKNCVRPTNVTRFLRELCKKYFLAEKVSRFLYNEISYESMLQTLMEVFPSLEFAATAPGIVLPDPIYDTPPAKELLSSCLTATVLDECTSVPVYASFDEFSENLTFDTASSGLDYEPWTMIDSGDFPFSDDALIFDESDVSNLLDPMLDTMFLGWGMNMPEETKLPQFREDSRIFMTT